MDNRTLIQVPLDLWEDLKSKISALTSLPPEQQNPLKDTIDEIDSFGQGTTTRTAAAKSGHQAKKGVDYIVKGIQESIIKREEDFSELTLNLKTVKGCTEDITNLKTAIRNQEKRTILYAAQMGEVCQRLKVLCKNKTALVALELGKTHSEFSCGHVRFLIQLYDFCNKYNEFLQCGLSLHFVKGNFPNIRIACGKIWGPRT